MLRNIAHDFTGITVPLIAIFAFALPLLHRIVRNKLFPPLYALVVLAFVAIATTTIYLEVSSSGLPIVYAFGGWPPPVGISYEVDGLSALLGLYVGWMMLGIAIFSLWYNVELDEPEWYYTLLLGLAAGAIGCLYTGDAFNLFVMLEVLSISIYGLISYHRSNPGALEAAFKYGIVGATATTIYFTGLVIIYGFYGSLNMANILEQNLYLHRAVIERGAEVPELELEFIGRSAVLASALAVSLALWVFTFKAGLFPNHFWIPDAYCESPSPISAALPSISEVVGVYVVARFLYTMFPEPSPIGYIYRDVVLVILLILGFLGGVVGALMMLVQRDVKRLYGYSSISHIGLMFMVLSIGSFTNSDEVLRVAFAALLTHVVAHGAGKLLLFSSTEVFIRASGSKAMDDMRGVGRKYPLVSLALIFGLLNLAGAIPFIGFFSKLLMYEAFMSVGQLLPAAGIVVVSALSIPGYAKPIYSIVFATPAKEFRDVDVKWFKYFLLAVAAALIAAGAAYVHIYKAIDVAADNSVTSSGLMKYLYAYLETRIKLWG